MSFPLLLQENGVTETTKEIAIWDLVVAGEWYIMVPLGILSIMSVYIFVERLMAVTKAAKEEKNFMNQIKDYIRDGKVDSAATLCQTTDNPIARMIGKGIEKIGKPLDDIGVAIENVGKLEIGRLEKRLSALATIAGAAPMIGFLGTTIGMIRTFHDMSIKGSVRIDDVAPGIMQAMVTTVGGLIVGIIAYVAYNYLVSKVERVVHKMESNSIEFMDLLDQPGK